MKKSNYDLEVLPDVKPELKETLESKDTGKITQIVSGLSNNFEKIFSQLDDIQDTKEKVLTNFTESLFSDDKLYMIARLDTNLAYHIIKHIIIKEFYYKYYTACKFSVTFEKIEIFPFYKTVPHKVEPKKEDLGLAYDLLITRLLQITISYNGQGRTEILQIIKALYTSSLQEEEIKAGQNVVKRFW